MADERRPVWADAADVFEGSGPAPAGLQQKHQRVRNVAEDTGRLPVWAEGGLSQSTRDWYTGANASGINSGYDITDGFIDKMQTGYSQAREQEGGLRGYFDFKKSGGTGVATYDYEEDDRKYSFGDIYEDGVFKGNIYDESKGVDKYTADLLMLDLTETKETKARLFASSDREERVAKAVQDRRAKNNVEIPQGRAAADFEEDVQERQATFQEGPRDEIAATAAGAAGGAALGAGIGSAVLPGPGTLVGGITGGVLGGVGGFLNRDELTDAAARAYEVTGLATEEFGLWRGGLTAGLNQWSGVSMKLLNPFGNLTRGTYDLAAGDLGDGREAFYEVDDEGNSQAPTWMKVVNVGSMVADGLVQFASPTGVALYSAGMGSSIVGEMGLMAGTGSSFDDRRGGFDNVWTDEQGNFDLSSGLAGIGKIGVDVIQMGMGRGLVNRVADDRAELGLKGVQGLTGGTRAWTRQAADKVSDKLPLWAGGSRGLEEGQRRVRMGGSSFTQDMRTGEIIEGSRRATLSILAPSEAAATLSVGNLARRQALRDQRNTVVADDYYRAAQSFAMGEHKLQQAFVNAVGESMEEGLQAVLEPLSHNHAPDAAEIYESMAAGAAMGLGMSIGANLYAVSQDDRMFAAAQASHAMAGLPELTRSQWRALTQIEKQAAAAMTPMAAKMAQAVAEKIQDSQGATMTASVSDIARLDDAIRTAQDSSLARASSRTDGAYVITGIEDAGTLDDKGNLLPGSMSSDSVVSSHEQVAISMRAHLIGLNEQVEYLNNQIAEARDAVAQELAGANERLARLQRHLATAQLTVEMAVPIQTSIEEAVNEINSYLEAGDEVSARASLDELNSLLRNIFHRKFNKLPTDLTSTPTEEQLKAMARAVTFVYVREPKDQSGSFLSLLPQASWALTREKTNHLLQISHAVLAPISGDYDGDKIRQQAKLVLSDTQFEASRAGDHLIGAGSSVHLVAQKREKWILKDLGSAAADGGSASDLAATVLLKIDAAIKGRYPKAPQAQLDAALSLFKDAALAGNPKAREVLYKELGKISGAISERAHRTWSNEWLWIDQVVDAYLQEFQRGYAFYRKSSQDPNTDVVPATRQTRGLKGRKALKASTFMQTLMNYSPGPTIFRSFQKLHYTANMAPVLGTDQVDANQMAELSALYEMLGQKITGTMLEGIRSKDNLTGEVFAQVVRLASSAHTDPAFAAQLKSLGMDMAQAPVILANTQVQDFKYDEQGNAIPVAGKISLTQLLLRMSVERDQREKAGILSRDEGLRAKHARLLELSRPSKDGVNAERAFLEVFGSVPMYDLIGEDANIFGAHLTMEQFLRGYQSMHEHDRFQTDKNLMSEPGRDRNSTASPPYGFSALTGDNAITPYYAVLDAILNVGRHELSADKNGKVSGDKADRDRRVSQSFHSGFETIQRAAREFAALSPKEGETTAQTIQRMFERFPDRAREFLALLPDSAIQAYYEIREGEHYISPWLYEAFAQPDAKAAEMHYWRSLLMAQWNASGASNMLREEDSDGSHARKFSSLERRMLRVMYRLAANRDNGAQLRVFMQEMYDANDLQEFMQLVNRNEAWRGAQAPLLPWIDDTAEFDPDKTSGGWSKNLSGSELRLAITQLQKGASQLLSDLHEEKQAEAEDNVVFAAFDRIAAGEGTDADRRMAGQLQGHLDMAYVRLDALGPAAMQYQTIGSLLGLYAFAHTKGQNPTYYAAMGGFEASRDALGYSTNFERVMAAFTSQSLTDLGNNLGQLARGDVRTMDDDGNPIEWTPPTVEKILELLRDPETRPFARAILFPSVMEHTADGRITQQFLVGKSLKELLEGKIYDKLFQTNSSGRLQQGAAMGYASLLETYSRKHGAPSAAVQRMVNRIVMARTSTLDHPLTAYEAERMTAEAYREVAEVMQMIGSVAAAEEMKGESLMEGESSMLYAVERATREALRDHRARRMLDLTGEDGKILGEIVVQQLIDDKVREAEEIIRELSEAYDQTNDPDEQERLTQRIEGVAAARDEQIERITTLLEGNFFDNVVNKFTIPKDSAGNHLLLFGGQEARREILNYIKATGTLLSQRVPNTMDAADEVFRQLSDPENNGSVELSDADWDLLSQGVIAMYMDQVVGEAPATVTVPLFPDATKESQRQVYDPTWAYLVDGLFDPSLVEAAKDLAKLSGRIETPLASDLAGKISDNILDQRRLGDWTTAIATQTLEADFRLDASAAAFAIAMAGNSPKTQATISGATRRSYLRPKEEQLATTRFGLERLLGEDFETIPVIAPGATGAVRQTPLAQLNNRFVRNVTLHYIDEAGEEIEYNLLDAPFVEVGHKYRGEVSVRRSGYKTITLERLRRAVELAVEHLPGKMDNVQIALDFFDPADQPSAPEWMHNVYFEGGSFELSGNPMNSLNEELWFSPGGGSQTPQRAALDANKLGVPALKVLPPLEPGAVASAEAGWETDLMQVLQRKTQKMMETDLGSGLLDPTFYNAVLKNFKIRHFVRGKLDGVDVVWTAEQVIEWQQQNRASIHEKLDGAEMWIPSDAVLREMLGEMGALGTPGIDPTRFDINIEAVPTFTHLTPRQLEFALPKEAVALEETRITLRARQHQFSVRPVLDEATINSYDLRIKKLAAQQAPIYADRAFSLSTEEGGFHPRKNLARAVSAAGEALQGEQLAFDWSGFGLPWIGSQRVHDASLSQMVLRSLAATMSADTVKTGWVYNHVGVSNPLTGELTQSDLGGQHEKPALRVAPGDLVVVGMDSFRNDQKAMRRVLEYFVDQGAIITLVGEGGGSDMRNEGGAVLDQLGYSKMRGAPHAYEPAEVSSRYQNRRATESMLTEWRPVTTRNKVSMFVTRGEYLTESTAWVVPKKPGEREALRSVGVNLNLIPTDFLSDMNVPKGAQVDQVRAHLTEMLKSAAGKEFLARAAKEDELENPAGVTLEKAIERLLERWSTSAGTVLPQPGDSFGTGDIIPLVNNNNQVLLYRHGYKAPTRETMLDQWAENYRGDSADAGNVAIFPSQKEPAATTHEGKWAREFYRPGFGMAVELHLPLSVFGDKKQLEWNGMKYILGPINENFSLPEHAFFANGWGVDMVVDADTLFSKEAFGGLVNNHRNAFAFFGVDFMPVLQRFFGLDEGSVNELLATVARKGDRIPVRHANLLIQSTYGDPALRSAILSAFGEDTNFDWMDNLDNQDPDAVIVRTMLTYLLTAGAHPSHVLRSGGFNSPEALAGDGQSILMPPLFTQVFDNAPLGSPLRTMMNKHFNQQLYNPNSDGTGYVLGQDWSFEIHTDDGVKTGKLQFADVHSSGDNAFKDAMSYDVNDQQPASYHSAMITGQAIGAETAYVKSLKKTKEFLNNPGVVQLRDAKDGGVWKMLTDIPEKSGKFDQWRMPTPLEQQRLTLNREAMKGFRQAISQENWTTPDKDEYAEVLRRISEELGFRRGQSEVVDFWVRQILGMPKGEAETSPGVIEMVGHIPARAAVEAANDILWNLARGYLPVVGAEVPQLHVSDLQLIFRGKKWAPALEIGSSERADQNDWNTWVEISLGAAAQDNNSIFDPLYLTATDGFMNTYQNATESIVGLPVSRDALVQQGLLDPDMNRMAVSISRNVNTLASEQMILDTEQATLSQLLGGQRIGGRYIAKTAPASAIAKRRKERREWRRKNNLPYPLDITMRNFKKNGAQFVNSSSNTNALFRMLINLRVGTALINPALWLSAGPEMWLRSAIDTSAAALAGTSTTGVVARGRAAATEGTAEAMRQLEAAKEQGPEAVAALPEEIKSLASRGTILQAVGADSRFTREQVGDLDQLYKTLGRRGDFKQMVYGDLLYLRQSVHGISKFEKGTEKYARLGTFMQDPTWGMRSETLAKRYMEAALRYVMAQPTVTVVSIDAIIAAMNTNPYWIRDNMPEVHQAAANAIAQNRSLKMTPLSLALRGIYEPLSQRPGLANVFGTLFLKLPFMFSGFAFNVATTLTGMQGFSDATALFLDKRNTPFTRMIGRASARLKQEEFDPDTWQGLDMSEVIEGIDLSHSIIRGGVTFTGMFTAGMLMGSSGLGGEDEEMRRRRRAAELQGGPVIYDPRKVENDFRSADALFLDSVPGLNKLVNVIAGEDGKSIVHLPWALKQFVSPAMGIARFLDTGDPQQVVWGFKEAMLSFPLINGMMWDDAVRTWDQLTQEAAKEAGADTPEGMTAAMRLLINGVGTFERMLFENAFVNSLYVSLDAYDRDPYKLPEADDTGDLRKLYTPSGLQPYAQNTALEDFVDEDGNLKQGWMGRSFSGTQFRVLSENRGTLAVMGSLLSGKGLGGDTIRYNMPIKTRALQRPEMTTEVGREVIAQLMSNAGGAASVTVEEAENLLIARNKAMGSFQQPDALRAEAELLSQQFGVSELSVIDDEGREVLTKPGAAAVLEGLVQGTVQFGDESLRGIYITPEQREQIQAEWMADLKQEGVDLGLTERQAFFRATRIWNGPSDNPEVKGISDFLWSNEIPWSPKIEYNQLNTTYVTGPDGLPMAVGIKRGGVMDAFGLIPKTMWSADDMGGAVSLDERFNVQDARAGINTGLRALEPTREDAIIPGEKEIKESIDKALEELKKLKVTPTDPITAATRKGYGSGRRYSGGYRSGGGGGYSKDYPTYFSRLYELPGGRATYGGRLPLINTSNPIIRRESIRRERITSERGRLNQWQ